MLSTRFVTNILHLCTYVFISSGVAAACPLADGNTVKNITNLCNGLLKAAAPGRLPLEKFGNKYYYFGFIEKGNYFQATQFCNFHGMALLSIETKEENDFLFQKAKNLLGAGEYHFWTSGTILAQPYLVWLATGRIMIYANWFPKQPDNAGGNEKCVEVRYAPSSKGLMWNDHVCTVEKYLICESIEVDCTSIIDSVPPV